MRLSTDPDRDDARALATVTAALDAGVVLLDTARAYGRDEADVGHNEGLIARALAARPPQGTLVTKCGMRRDGGAWIPDGRASRIIADAKASVATLGDVPIDVLSPSCARRDDGARDDGTRPRARACGRPGASGRGVECLAQTARGDRCPRAITAVEVAWGAYDDLPMRNGVLAYCFERGIEVIAHGSLRRPKRAPAPRA